MWLTQLTGAASIDLQVVNCPAAVVAQDIQSIRLADRRHLCPANLSVTTGLNGENTQLLLSGTVAYMRIAMPIGGACWVWSVRFTFSQ